MTRLNAALSALIGAGDWSFVKEMPPDALVVEVADGRRWIVQAHLSRGIRDEGSPLGTEGNNRE